jgi:hypothetical protein
MYRKSVLTGDFQYAVEREFERVEQGFNEFAEALRLKELYAEPNPKRNGMIVYADGTNWNPGSGRGVYVYKGSSWVLLG